MSKMTEAIEKLIKGKTEVKMYIPGRGYVFGRVDSLKDDTVTLKPAEGKAVVIHYTQFSIERE